MAENRKPTQADKILRHLQDFGSITSLEAMQDYGIMRLASRIHELKAARNIPISVHHASGRNRYGETTTYAVYTLEGGHNDIPI